MGVGDGLFGLLGPVVGWGSILLAGGMLLLGVLVVPRILRRGERATWRTAAVQGVTILLCTVLTVLAAGVWLNRSFIFYGSWGDLLDGAGAGVRTHLYGAASGDGIIGGSIGRDRDPAGTAVPRTHQERSALEAARTAPVTEQQAHPLRDPALQGITDTAEGQYVTVHVPDSAHAAASSMLVHLPAGYLQHPERRYPVIMAFSGIPGSPGTWRQAFRIGEQVDELAAQGRIAPSIVVIPTVFPGTQDTECVDADPAVAGGHQQETWIVRDVADWVRTHLRTIEDPFAWATIGYSAGGWCASMISVRHPDLARASISLAGYFRPLYADGQQWTAADDPRYDLPSILAREHPPVVMYFFAGGQDKLADPSLAATTRALQAPSALTVQRTRHGGHMITLWIAQLPSSLGWLGRHCAGFVPEKQAHRHG